MEVSIKKEGWAGGGHRFVKVIAGTGDETTTKVSGKTLIVSIGPGLPNTMSNDKHRVSESVLFFQQFVSGMFLGPTLRLEPDHETLQVARRVVTVVSDNRGMNNNNHIHNHQASSRVYAQVKSSTKSTVSSVRPVRNAPPAPSNPAPNIPRGPSSNTTTRTVAPSGSIQRNPSMRSTRAPPPPSQPPPANQPVLRPPLQHQQANNPAGGFRLPNPGALRLPNVTPGKRHHLN